MLEIVRRVEDGRPDRDCDPMFACPLVVFVCRTRATVRQAVVDRHEVLVVARVFVARVANEHSLFDEFEFKGFVLSPLERPLGRVEAIKWISITIATMNAAR